MIEKHIYIVGCRLSRVWKQHT